jgi:hypothetical protein
MVFECLIVKNLSKAIKLNNKSMGYIAGYISKAALNSPRTKCSNDLCIPHPGQSKPNNFLVKQGNI